MKSSRSGQSIIEAMVAISILTMGLLGILTLLTKSFQLTRVVNDQTTATYLASEGIEITKSLIDHDVYLGIASNGNYGQWGNCFPANKFARGGWLENLDYQTTDCASLVVSRASFKAPLYMDPNTGLYSENSLLGSKTIFSRAVRIFTAGNEVLVFSTVYWPDPQALGVTDQIMVEDHFFNYIPTN